MDFDSSIDVPTYEHHHHFLLQSNPPLSMVAVELIYFSSISLLTIHIFTKLSLITLTIPLSYSVLYYRIKKANHSLLAYLARLLQLEIA